MSDVHAISETGWDAGQIKVLAEAMEADGHRLWAVAAETRSTAKSGTAILVRATVAPRPGDGPLWAKPDGKALAVAITIQDRPVVLLAVHLPHKNPLRVEFLHSRCPAEAGQRSKARRLVRPGRRSHGPEGRCLRAPRHPGVRRLLLPAPPRPGERRPPLRDPEDPQAPARETQSSAARQGPQTSQLHPPPL